MKTSNIIYTGYSALTHASISAFLGRTLSATEQTLATSIIAQVESYFARQCDRNFLYTETINSVPTDCVYGDVFDVDGLEYPVYNYPIKEVSKITCESTILYEKAGVNNSLTIDDDFSVYPTYVFFQIEPNYENTGRRKLIVEYSIQSVLGDDVKLGLTRWVSELISAQAYAGRDVTNLSINGVSVGLNSQTPNYIQTLINIYRKVSL